MTVCESGIGSVETVTPIDEVVRELLSGDSGGGGGIDVSSSSSSSDYLRSAVMSLNEEEIESAMSALEVLDSRVWSERHCRIAPKGGKGLVPLRYNFAQNFLTRVVEKIRSCGAPVRLIVLKARQVGVTTWGMAEMYRRICLNHNHTAAMVAHKDGFTTTLFDRLRMFYRYDPVHLPTQYSNRKELILAAPNHSRLWISTASPDLRSDMLLDFHGSEVAFWKNAKDSLGAVMASIPKPMDNPNTYVILESTANGLGGEFYDRWCNATPWEEMRKWVKLPNGRCNYDEGGFIAVFIPWHVIPEYRLKPPADFVMTDKEVELSSLYGLDEWQLSWRRYVIEQDCDGDEDFFCQEYPSCDSEAFLTSGRPVFPIGRLSVMLRSSCPPKEVGIMGGDSDVPELVEVPGRAGWVIDIWDRPKPHFHYVLGGDTAEGLVPLDGSDPDSNSAIVICLELNRVVAHLYGRFDPDLFAEQIDLLGRWYNHLLLGVETNNTSGGSTRSTLKRLKYPNLYYRERLDRTTDEMTEVIGWYTNDASRGIMISDLVRAVREGTILIPSSRILKQMMSFVRDNKGKPTAVSGEHDDDVMALAIAWQMALRELGTGAIRGDSVPAATGRNVAVQSSSSGGGGGYVSEVFTSDMIIGGREPDVATQDNDDEDGFGIESGELIYV